MKLRCFGFLYNPTNPKFYLFSLTLNCSRSPTTFFLLHFFYSIRNKVQESQKRLTKKKKKENTIFLILSIFFLCLLGAWCLGAEKMLESKGK